MPTTPGLLEFIRANHTGLLNACYPRSYASCGDFESPRVVGLSVAASLLANAQMPAPDDPMKHAGLTSYRLVRQEMPTYFVRRNLLEAAMNSAPPSDFKFSDLKWPRDALIFMLPRGSLASPSDGPCFFLCIAVHPPGWVEPLPSIPGYRCHVEQRCITFWAETENGMIFAGYHPVSKDPEIAQLVREGAADTSTSAINIGENGELIFGTITAAEDGFLNLLLSVALRLILLMNARPDLITESRLLRARKLKSKKSQSELWSPNIIGEGYRSASESASDHPNSLHGPSRAVRMHWRRGHYRQQPYGPGLIQRKLLWIEPVLIGANIQNN